MGLKPYQVQAQGIENLNEPWLVIVGRPGPAMMNQNDPRILNQIGDYCYGQQFKTRAQALKAAASFTNSYWTYEVYDNRKRRWLV